MKQPAGPKLAAQILEEYLAHPPDADTEDAIGADRETLGALPESPTLRAYAPHLRTDAIIMIERLDDITVRAIDAVRVSHPALGSRLVVTGARTATPYEVQILGTRKAIEIPLREALEATA